MSRDQDIFKP